MKWRWLALMLMIGVAAWPANAQTPVRKPAPAAPKTQPSKPVPQPAPLPPPRLPEFIEDVNAELRNAIRTRWVATARGEGARFYAEDAALLPPNAPRVNGRAAIEAFWRKMMDDGLKEMTLFPKGTAWRGPMAVESGAFEFTWAKPGQPPVHETGKYLAGLTRDDEGNWRVIYDIFNSDLPAGALPK